ncbi:MAG: hypothetical protein V7K89_10355 [Nostoc sp.]
MPAADCANGGNLRSDFLLRRASCQESGNVKSEQVGEPAQHTGFSVV